MSNTEKDKLGFNTEIKAEHPITKKIIPVYIANFVLMDYGLGAIFGCPAHDQRDLDFANKFKLDVITVIEPGNNIKKITILAYLKQDNVVSGSENKVVTNPAPSL